MDKKSLENCPFDFAKHEIDPDLILRKIWTSLQSRLSPMVVDHLAGRFVTEGIFIPIEIKDCHDSKILLQRLSERTNPQKATAINTICSEHIYQDIKETVKNFFVSQLETVAGTSMSGTSQNGTSVKNIGSVDDKIIAGKSEVNLVIKGLTNDTAWHENWPTLGYAMELDDEFIAGLKLSRITGMDKFEEILRKLINKWVFNKGTDATVKAFCKILDDEGLKMCAVNVRKAFQKS